jgi:GDP-4-dehydro-6-deoxy-D-mannose reductase
VRALVTGAGGFVGRHLVEHLVAHGDDVTATDRLSGGPELLDAAAMEALLSTTAPEVVYHLAGQSDIGASWDQAQATFRANAEGTLILLDACRAAGVQRVVAISSADVYGTVEGHELPITEDQPLRPATPYAASKAAAEMVAQQAWLGYGLETVRVRAFNHLGPGQSARFVAPALARRIAATTSGVVSVGNLSGRRDFTDVRDVVAAYRLLAAQGEPGQVYNVCSGTDVSIQQLAETMLALSGSTARLEVDPELYRPMDTPRLVGSNTRVRAATGWTPLIPLDQTLRDVLADAAQPAQPHESRT